VFFVLVKAEKEMSVGEIQEAVEIAGPTLSHHLDILRRAGLLESRKEERYVYYTVKQERVTALVRLLTACC
jgi:ArsR family transcriptional regulator